MLKPLRLCALAASLVACGPDPGNDEGAPGERTTLVDALSMPGVVVMVSDSGTGQTSSAFGLWDPRTNLRSEVDWPAGGTAGGGVPIAPSPDGTLLAYTNPVGDRVNIVRIIDDAGRPNLELVHSVLVEFDDRHGAPVVGFSAFGDRVVTQNHWIRVDTGELFTCKDGNETREITPLGDGYYFRCGDALYRDGEYVAAEFPGEPNPDGQLVGADRRFPALAGRGVQERPPRMDELPINGPTYVGHDGQWWSADSFTNGEVYVMEQASNGGFLDFVCKNYTLTGRGERGGVTSPHAAWADGELAPLRQRWSLRAAIEPFYEEADSRVGAAVGRHAVTDELIYRVVLQRGVAASCQNIAVDAVWMAVSPDGTSRIFRTAEEFDAVIAPGTAEMPAAAGPWGDGVLPYADGDWLVAGSAANALRLVGIRNGAPFHAEVDALDNEGRIGLVARFEGEQWVNCATAFEAGSTACVPQEFGGTPAFVLAEGVLRGDAIAEPIVRGVSHTARAAGDTIAIFGAGFGDQPQTVYLGDHAIAAADVLSWTDRRVDLQVSDAWPEAGALAVESNGVRSASDGIVRWFTRTPRLTTPLDGVPDPLVLSQGLNRFDLGLPDGVVLEDWEPDGDGLYSIWSPGGPLEATEPLRISDGEFWRDVLREGAEDLIDSGAWEPVAMASGGAEGAPVPSFRWLADRWMTRAGTAAAPRLGARVFMDPVHSTNPALTPSFGIPSHARMTSQGLLSSDRVFTDATLLTGWEEREGGELWGLTVAPDGLFPRAYEFGTVGDFALARLPQRNGTGGIVQLSADGGRTFGPEQTLDTEYVTPVGVVTPDGPAALMRSTETGAFEAWFDGSGLRTAEVVVEADADVPFARDAELFSVGSFAIAHLPRFGGSALALLDASATPARITRALEQDVRSITFDPATNTVYAVTLDGAVQQTPFGGGALAWSPVDLDPVLSDGTPLDVHQIMPLGDRWLIVGEVAELPVWAQSYFYFAVSPAP